MSEPKFSKFETVSLKGHPNFNEKWVQNRIAEDPSILGLGDLVLLNEELIQPNGGRLDLLLYDSESEQRYEVEIQLGRVDESHIIRTIEYWDIEKKRYPQYDHTAVIIAEEITGRLRIALSRNAFRYCRFRLDCVSPILSRISSKDNPCSVRPSSPNTLNTISSAEEMIHSSRLVIRKASESASPGSSRSR